MATLNLSLPAGTSVCNGKQVTFTAPCSCENVTSLKINGTNYTLVNTMGESVAGQKSVWAAGSLVTVVLDADNHKAYLSAGGGGGSGSVVETNKGLEQKFWRGTRAEYNAISTKDEATLYIVTDDVSGNALPTVSSSDNDKILCVVNGSWSAVAIADAEGVGF